MDTTWKELDFYANNEFPTQTLLYIYKCLDYLPRKPTLQNEAKFYVTSLSASSLSRERYSTSVGQLLPAAPR